MSFFKNPAWIKPEILAYNTLDEVPQSLLDEIKQKLSQLVSQQPEVSIVIPVWNEELNIVKALSTLVQTKTNIPLEIIVVNNNSTDRTQQVLDSLNVTSYMEKKQGIGPARQLGQVNAKGTYILMADADCFYPSGWVENMMRVLKKKNVACVYGRHSFLGSKKNPRWQFFFYERLRDILVEFRHFKRPYLNSLGMSMGYVRQFGVDAGFIDHMNAWGEDGRFCYELMRYGKVKMVRGFNNRVWTTTRTLDKEGSFLRSLIVRVLLELTRFTGYFRKIKPHDAKSSKNPPSFLFRFKFFKSYKETHKY
ncbi:MAG: glycosyltransferase family 2 protein [Cyclobacteriaceae bacterium]|nr:MAG: glycosyltransferase family 2 protein [Cyclobacteriaceae bacterium]